MKKLVTTLALSVLLSGNMVANAGEEFVYAQFDSNSIIIKDSITQINCDGLNRETDGKDDFLMVVTSPFKRCMEYNRGEPFHIMSDRDMKGRLPNMDFNVRPDYFQEYKTTGRQLSEGFGLYGIINAYGLERGLVKIKAFFTETGYLDPYSEIEYHMKHVPTKVIVQGAKKFPYSEDVKKFLAKVQTIALN